MELEDFIEQYKLRHPQPFRNTGRLLYDYKMEGLREFFFDLQRESLAQNMSVDEARLCIRFYDEGYDVGFMGRVISEEIKNLKKPE